MDFDTLDQYEAEIQRIAKAYYADPNAVLAIEENPPGEFEGEWYTETHQEDAWLHYRCRLLDLSVSIRRKLWNFRDKAQAIAARADALANQISAEHDDPCAPLPRWPATYSDCSGWSPGIQ